MAQRHSSVAPPRLRPPIDTELVDAAVRGDADARTTLFERHFDYAFGLAFRLTGRRQETEEIVQDVMVEALQGLSGLRDHDAFRSWLGQIVVRTTHRHFRRKRYARIFGLLGSELLDVHSLVAPGAAADVIVHLEQLYRAMDQLPHRVRMALVMRHMEGRKIDEIGLMLGGSRASVKRWLAAGEAHLRRSFGPPPDMAVRGR